MKKPNQKILSTAAALSLALLCIPSSVLSVSALQEDETADTTPRISVASESREGAAVASASRFPQGAFKMNVNINGRDVLNNMVFNLNGHTYVPMFRFADWLGVFDYTYYDQGYVSVGKISGTNLEISAVEGNLYIMANGRYFYTDGEVVVHNDQMYIPIRALVKALNCYVSYDSSQNKFIVKSGDTRLLKNHNQVYNQNDIYWLARIISAEARGESLQGKIAVGNVVLNRVRSSQFPNTIKDVIFDTKYGIQFAPVANGTIYSEPTEESIIAAKICIEGYSLSSDILYFFNPKASSSSWISKNRPYAFTLGNHAFYN